MMTFYRGLERKLLCEIMHLTNIYRGKIKFEFRHLLEDIDCTAGY